jgi:arabinan endo-1,5-alpha-L-arabinosidase
MSGKTTSNEILVQDATPKRRRRMRNFLALIMVTMIALSAVAFARQSASAASVSPGITVVTSPFVHDPSRIIKEGNTYYAYSTGYDLASLTSTDLTHWKSGKPVLPNGTPAWARKAVPLNNGSDIWAPDLIFNNGLYYMYYAICGGKACATGLITSPTLNQSASNYKWTDRGEVIGNTATQPLGMIDPAPFFDASGNMWLSVGSGYCCKATDPEIFEVSLNKNTGLRSDNVMHAVENGRIEASYVYYHKGYYFLFWNSGGCCSGASSTYEIHVARSSSVTGPYVDKSGKQKSSYIFIASHGSIHGPGQIGIFDTGSTSYYSYHYYPNSGGSVYGIGTLTWGSDGWPIAGA